MSKLAELRNRKLGITSGGNETYSVPEDTVNEIRKYFKDSFSEVEIKFKSKASIDFFTNFKEYLSKFIGSSKDETYTSETYSEGYRRTVHGSSVKYEVKKRIASHDFKVSKFDFRVSSSSEKLISKEEFEKNARGTKHVRDIRRSSFIHGNIRYDFSLVDSSEFELEIERVNSDCQVHEFTDAISLTCFIYNSYSSLSKSIPQLRIASVAQSDLSKPVDITPSDFNEYFLKNFSITLKLDGDRQLLAFINNIIFVADARNKFVLWSPIGTYSASSGLDAFIFEGERTPDGVLHVFDYMGVADNKYTSSNAVKYDLSKRLDIVKKVEKISSETSCVPFKIKKFEFGNFSEVCARILADADKNRIENDGLIFQFNGPDRKSALKWKPASHLTVDFYYYLPQVTSKCTPDNDMSAYMRSETREGLYIDASQGSSKKFEYVASINEVQHPKYMTHNDFACSVVECFFENGKWHIVRIRNKLPNHINVYNRIKNLIQNPITRETIEGKNMMMMRRVHNSVKRSILDSLPAGSVILDIGSGQGGDIDKWGRFSKVYAVEPDPEKHVEFERRLSLKSADVKNKITLIKSGFEKVDPRIIEKADFIIGFFSFTFFFKDQGKLDPVVLRQLSHMKKGAHLVGIVLDGDKVTVAMKGKKEVSCGDQWWIKKSGSSDHEISTFIKGSEYITGDFIENIVYVKKFVSLLEQNGFKKNAVDSIAKNLMSECNQKLNDLNTFFSFTKSSKSKDDDDDFVERDDGPDYEPEGERDRDSDSESSGEDSETSSSSSEDEFNDDVERVETDEFVPQAYKEIDGEDAKPITYPSIGQLVFNDEDDTMHNDYLKTKATPLVYYLGVPTDRLNIVHAANVATMNAKFGAIADKLAKNYLAYTNGIIDKAKFLKVKAEFEPILENDTRELLFSSEHVLKKIIKELTLPKFLELNDGYLAGGFQHRILSKLEKEGGSVNGILELNNLARSEFIEYLSNAELGERSMLELLTKYFKKDIHVCTIIKGQLKLVKSFSAQNMNSSDRVLLFTPDGVTYFPASPTDEVKSLTYIEPARTTRSTIAAAPKKQNTHTDLKKRIQALHQKDKRYIITRLANGIEPKNANKKLDDLIDQYVSTFSGKGDAITSLQKIVTSGEESFEIYKNFINSFIEGDVKKFQKDMVFMFGLKTFYSDKFFEIGKAISTGASSSDVAALVDEINTTRSVDDIFKQVGQKFIASLSKGDHASVDAAKRIHYLVGGKIFKLFKKKKSVDESKRRLEYFPDADNKYLGYKFEINMSVIDFLSLNDIERFSFSFDTDSIKDVVTPFAAAVSNAGASKTGVDVWTRIEDVPQTMKYDPALSNKKLKIHNGQKKLYLCELQYLTEKIGVRGKDTTKNPVFIVYAGAAPAHSRYDLSEMFPNVKFIMVDPNEFKIMYAPNTVKGGGARAVYEYPSNDLIHDKVLYIKEGDAYASKDPNKKYKNTVDYKESKKEGESLSEFIANSNKGRFFIIEDFYTTELSKQLKDLGKYGEVHFWSDIRTAGDDDGKSPLDIDILWNSVQHALWIDALKPKGAMLKFRLPFKNEGDNSVRKKYNQAPYKYDFDSYDSLRGYPDILGDYGEGQPFKYYDGEVKLQTWAPETSAETRLWISFGDDFKPKFKVYNSSDYEGKLFYFNSVVRPNGVYFKNDHADRNLHFDHCANCALENKIISDYYTKVAGVTDDIELNRRVKDKVLHLIKVSGNRGLDANGHGQFF